MDWIIGNVQSAGLHSRWTMHFLFYATAKGKIFAEDIKATVPAYGGQEEPGDDSVLPLIFNVLSIGYSSASVMVMTELLKRTKLANFW